MFLFVLRGAHEIVCNNPRRRGILVSNLQFVQNGKRDVTFGPKQTGGTMDYALSPLLRRGKFTKNVLLSTVHMVLP